MIFFFVAPRYHTNQIPIVEKLIEEGNQVNFYVITSEGSEDHSLIEPKFIKPNFISRLLFKSKHYQRKFLIPNFKYLFKEFRSNKPDVCIIRNPHYFYSFIFIIVALFYKSKVLLYTQDPYYLARKKIRHSYYLWLIRLFNVKWITPVLGDKNSGSVLSENIYHIPLPIEVKYFTLNKEEDFEQKNNIIRILMVGKFVKWKRHDLFVKAIKEVSKNYPNVKATIVGECTTAEHKEIFNTVSGLIDENKITNISIEINVEHNELLKMYNKFDLFILPSSGETFGISSLEALSCGLPIIISNKNGFKYYVEDGVIGYVFDSDSLEDLINKTECCLNEKKYVQMGVQALSFTKKYFSKSTYYEKLNVILNDWE